MGHAQQASRSEALTVAVRFMPWLKGKENAGRFSVFGRPSRTRASWSAECPTAQRVPSHHSRPTIPERSRSRGDRGLRQAALRCCRSAECPIPQRVRRHSSPGNIPGHIGARRRCGLRKTALRSCKTEVRSWTRASRVDAGNKAHPARNTFKPSVCGSLLSPSGHVRQSTAPRRWPRVPGRAAR